MNKLKLKTIIGVVAFSIGCIPFCVNADNTMDETSMVAAYEKEETTDLPIVAFEKNGLIKVNGVWGYYKDDKLQTDYTGIKVNENGIWYVKNGIIDFSVNGLYKADGIWFYVKDNKIDLDTKCIAKNKNGTWLVEDGMVNFDAKGLKKVNGEWYYFKGGAVQTKYTGIKSNKNGTWLVEKGHIDFDYSGTYTTSGSVSKPKKGQERYYVSKNKINDKRSTIITKALSYVGTPYVYGGSNLKKGIDCSGFTSSIYKLVGINLTRTSRSQAVESKGKKVSLDKAKPGDLVFYSYGKKASISHVAIYLGNGKIVHASSNAKKVKISDVNIGMTIKCIKSFI